MGPVFTDFSQIVVYNCHTFYACIDTFIALSLYENEKKKNNKIPVFDALSHIS